MGAVAKAHPKVKARARPVRRAGRGAPVRRRPAVRGGDVGWKDGVVMKVEDIKLDELEKDLHLVLMDASYYRTKCNVAGKVKSIEALGADRYVYLHLTGTTSEDMLKVSTAKPSEAFKVHLCVRGCGEDESGDFIIHAEKARVIQDITLEEDWILNLESVRRPAPVDELALLREREVEEAPREPKEKVTVSSSSSSAKSKKKKKKAKKKKEKKKKKKRAEKDKKVPEDPAKEEKGKRPDGTSPMVDSTKTLEALFSGTGLDPKERVRKKVVKKARSYLGKRNKEKDSSTGSSSSTSSSEKEGEDPEEMRLFNETGKCRALCEGFPGVLTQASLVAMREALLLEMGAEAETSGPKPSALMYARQQLSKRASGPVLREVLNLCTALDHIIKGNPARAADVISQRLKSLELILGGSHWSVAQRLECTGPDNPSISSRSEVKTAQRETYEDVRMRQLAAHPGPRREDPKGKGHKGKTKDEKGGAKGKGHWEQREKKDGKEGGHKGSHDKS